MSTSTPPRQGSPELWLTPLIGVVLLGPLIWHWRMRLLIGPFASGWHMLLRANIALCILIGLAPLLVAAVVQRLFRVPKWSIWVQGLAAGVIAAAIVGNFYYYVLYPLTNWSVAQSEGPGNDVMMFASDAYDLGIAAGLAVFLSAFATAALGRRGGGLTPEHGRA